MSRKFLSPRLADLERQLESVGGLSTTAVDSRAMILAHENHQKRHTVSSIMVRLRAAFRERQNAVAKSRAEREHDRPGCEHPTVNQWRLFLASDDFAAFVCYCLRIEVADQTPRLEIARWIRRLRLKEDTGRLSLGTLFRECIASANDEWQQDNRHGSKDAAEMEVDIELLEALEAAADEIVQADSTNVDSLAI